MAIFEEEPDELEEDPGLEAPPAPWEYEPELPPEIEQGEDRPVPEIFEYEEPPQPKVPPEDKYGPPPQIPSDEPGQPSPDGPVYPGERPYREPPPQVVGPKIPAQLLDKKFAQMDGQWYDPKSGRWMQPDSTARDASGNRDLEYSKYDKTLDYMYDEMIRNVNSRQVKSIQELLDFTGNPSLARYGNSALYFTAAMSEWASMVGTGQEWDHKPKLDSMLGLREANDYYFPIRGDTEHKYYYNIWSNIHYGYVGSAAGFDAETLHRGGDSMIPFTPIKYDPTSAISIQIGIDLWNQKGTGLRPEDIQQAILAHTQDYMRYRPEFETVVPRKRGR